MEHGYATDLGDVDDLVLCVSHAQQEENDREEDMEDTDSSEDVAHTKEFLDKDKERTRYDHRDEGSDKTHEPSYFGGHLVDDADQDDAGDGERDIGKYKWVC